MNLRKINDVSLTASGIGIGDVIKVGENAYLKIDKIPDELQYVFDEIRNRAERSLADPDNAKFFEKHEIPMSQFLFANVFGFAKIIAEEFPDLGCKDSNSRRKFYADHPTANLTELFKRHLFQCSEFATIAQLYLQSIGVDSEYVGGEFMRDKSWEFGEQHSFVIIHEENTDFVFDPANNNAGNIPNISIIELTPEQKVKIQAKLLTGKEKVAFFETRDILTNRKTFYGYGDGCNISEDAVFSKEQPVQNLSQMDMSRK